MKKQDKILMPIDFSECTLNTLLYAKSIAESTQADLELLYVKSKDAETKTPRQNDYKERLAEIVDKDERLKSFPVTLNVCEGDRINEIIKFHKRHKCNLIVMGTKGANNLSRKFFGTNTLNIIQKVNCPVLAIPCNHAYKPIEKLVITTDMHSQSLKLMEDSMHYFQELHPEVHILHLNKESDMATQTEFQLSDLPGSVRKRFSYPGAKMYVSSFKDFNHGLDHFLQKHHADLLIMFTKRRRFWESLFNKSLTLSRVGNLSLPLLAYPM